MKEKGSEAPALDRGLSMLEYIVSSGGEVGFNELTEALDLPVASMNRFLKVLTRRGYLVKDQENGLYNPGPVLVSLGGTRGVRELLKQESEDVLRDLSKATENTALVVYWNGFRFECVNKVMNENSLAMQNIGDVREDVLKYPWSPFIVDELSESRMSQEMKKWKEGRAFLAKIKENKKQFEQCGYCFFDEGIRRFSAPIFRNGKVVGAVGLGGNQTSIPDDKVKFIGEKTAESAKKLSGRLSEI